MELGNFFSDPMSALGLGNDFLADSPVGSFLGMAQNKEAKRQFNTNLDWQKYQFKKQIELANTAHQREIEDLEKAGLNPVLSAGGQGLGVPSGQGGVSPTAHMDNGSAGLGFITNLLSGVSAIKNSNSAQTVANATDKKATAEANLMNSQAELNKLSAGVKAVEAKQAEKVVESTLSKSPRNAVVGVTKGIGDIIESGSHTQTANKFERLGERLGDSYVNARFNKFGRTLQKLDRKTKGVLKPYIHYLKAGNEIYEFIKGLSE